MELHKQQLEFQQFTLQKTELQQNKLGSATKIRRTEKIGYGVT